MFFVSVCHEASKDDDVEIPPPPPALPSTDLKNSRDDKNYISSKVIFSIKFIYWYSAVIGMSFIVCFCCIFRLRHPNTGVFGSKLMQNIHKLLPIEFEIEGEELLKCPKAAVVVLNHQSSIDQMVLFEIWPILGNCGLVSKKEFFLLQPYMWPYGLALWMCGGEFINKGSKTSHEAFNQIGARATEEAKKLMIFPEGKLNTKKGLTMLPFKKGAFHIAIDGKVPILPVVISDFLNAKKMIFNPGKVTIKVLPRIDTSQYTKENIYDLVTHTRNIMIEELKKISKQKSD